MKSIPTPFPAEDDAALGTITHDHQRSRSRLAFSGELDLGVRERFDDVLAELAGTEGPIDLDWSAVTFSGAEGLRMLVELRVGLGSRVASSRSSPVMDRLADLFGLGLPLTGARPAEQPRIPTPRLGAILQGKAPGGAGTSTS